MMRSDDDDDDDDDDEEENDDDDDNDVDNNDDHIPPLTIVIILRIIKCSHSLDAADAIYSSVKNSLLLLPVLPLSTPYFFGLLDAFGNAVLYSHAKV